VVLLPAAYWGLAHQGNRWPSAVTDRAEGARAEVGVEGRPQPVRAALLMVPLCGAVTFGLAIAAARLGAIGQEVGLIPGVMVAPEAACPYRAERLGTGSATTAGLVPTSGWRRGPRSGRKREPYKATSVSRPVRTS
jgi:hypothetical protein